MIENNGSSMEESISGSIVNMRLPAVEIRCSEKAVEPMVGSPLQKICTYRPALMVFQNHVHGPAIFLKGLLRLASAADSDKPWR